MYTKFYGFKEKPFNIVSDPSFLYMSPKHRMALTYLEYGLMDGIGFILLTGEIGTGKTTLIKKLLKKVSPKMEVAVVFNTNVSADALLELILEEFELEVPERGKGATLDVLNQFLISKHGLGERVLLIVDEAQNLSHDALEEIRMLSNLQTDKASLLQILLVGQPGLRRRLQHPSLIQLSQRIAVSYHLRPLDLEETQGYISHRLKAAGGTKAELFSSEAVSKIFEHSQGVPRTINILCDAALVYGFADELAVIQGPVIDSVIRDRQEAGMMTCVPAGSQEEQEGEDMGADDRLVTRMENLERQVQHLAAVVDWQTKALERRADSYKDTLVQKLETMLAKERQRTDRLMIQYNLLRERLNLRKLTLRGKKSEGTGRARQPVTLAGDSENAATKDETSSEPGGRLRKWFSR